MSKKYVNMIRALSAVESALCKHNLFVIFFLKCRREFPSRLAFYEVVYATDFFRNDPGATKINLPPPISC